MAPTCPSLISLAPHGHHQKALLASREWRGVTPQGGVATWPPHQEATAAIWPRDILGAGPSAGLRALCGESPGWLLW